jgi:hypothetical protein
MLPFFNDKEPFVLRVFMYFKRPNIHYVGQIRTNTLTEAAESAVVPGSIDTYAKFFTRAMIGILYKNISQVQRLEVEMFYSDDPHSNGCTKFTITCLYIFEANNNVHGF